MYFVNQKRRICTIVKYSKFTERGIENILCICYRFEKNIWNVQISKLLYKIGSVQKGRKCMTLCLYIQEAY